MLSFVVVQPAGRLQLADLSDEIVKESMRRGSRDNITVLVVKLRPQIEGRNLFADEH
jgi:serine/threonine protein phosphatase PrpC